MSFEWQTEDDERWERPDAPSDERSGRTRWAWFLLFVCILGAGLFFGWRQVQDRVETTTEALRDEVRASYALARRAAHDRDQELFVSLLSGRSATWTEAQRKRLDENLMFSETGRLFGFSDVGSAGDAAVDFDPELSEAVLTVAQPLAVDAGSGLTETVAFTQTHVFRQGSQRWLLSPPDDAFWGDYRLTEGQVLQVQYAQRDEALVRRLADDLDRKLLEMCRTLVDCPPGFTMRVRLETDPQSILQAANGEAHLATGRELILPTPTLVGIPIDEMAYAALFRGYASYVVSAALVEQLDYTCCALVVFQEALIDWQLSRLSLRSAPLEEGDYLYVIDAPLDMQRYWRRTEPLAPDEEAPLEIHAFIDFMRSQLSMRRDPIRQLQLSLSQSRSFWGWVSSFTDYEPTDPTVLHEDLSEYVWEKAREAQALTRPLPAEWQPSQDIVAMCGDRTFDVYRYSILSDQWTRELVLGVEFAALTALPDGNGYMLSGQYPDQDSIVGIVTYLKRGEEEPFVIERSSSDGSVLLPWHLYEPGGDRLVVWLLDETGAVEGRPYVGLIDPKSCTSEGCTIQTLPGMPVWSPSGRLGLALDFTDGSPLYLPENRTSWQELQDGAVGWPVWINDETVVYVREETVSYSQTLTAFEPSTAEKRDIITGADLADAAGPGYRGESFRVSLILLHPYRDDTLFILATGSSRSFFFTLSPVSTGPSLSDSTPQLHLLETFEGVMEADFLVFNSVQNERYLLLTLPRDARSEGQRMVLYDLQTEEIVLTSVGGLGDGFLSGEGRWSADGRFLVRPREGAFDIIVPSLRRGGKPARQIVFHDFERCMLPTWVNR